MAKKNKKQTSKRASGPAGKPPKNTNLRTYTIFDYRLEKPSFTVRQVRKDDAVRYEILGDFSAPVPPIRESKYLTRKQHIEIYRWMLLNRKLEELSRISTSREK